MVYDQAFFDEPLNRRGTQSEKWDDPDMLPEGAIPMWVADMDFRCAPPITDAVVARAQHPCYGYNAASVADVDALRCFWQRRHGVDFSREQACMLPCVVSGLRLGVAALTRLGDGVIVLTPVYGPFYYAVENAGRRLIDCALTRDHSARYHMDFAAVERALKDGARMILLCNPHNPVSRLWSREELTALAALASAYDAVILSDEIHADFVYAPRSFVSMLSIPEAQDHCVALLSASKTFNIAGLQQSQAVSRNPELLEKIKTAARAAGAECGNTFALCATRAAYTQCDDWLDGLLAYLDGNRQYLKSALKEMLPKAVLTPIEATYLAWLDLRAYAPDCATLADSFKKHGVLLTDGAFFGKASGEGFMRLNFGCPRAQLEEAVKRVAAAMNQLIES